MEPKTALVRTDCRIKLNSETSVYLNVAVVVNPRNSELNEPFRFNKSVDYSGLYNIRSFFYNRLEAFKYFLYCLKKFFFTLVSLAYLIIYAL